MPAKRVRQQHSSWQPDKSQSKKQDSRIASRHAPIEVANSTPGTMMDNVMRSREQQQQPATPPREFVQPKLTIGEPNDKYEQEADRVAKQVVQRMQAPEPPTFSNAKEEEPSLQCKREAFQQIWRPMLQGDGAEGGTTSEEFDRTLNSARSGGQALDSGLQRSMGEAMGADFSGVKVHTDATANNLSESIQAKAFTTGRDVFFKRGAYQPGSRGGQELIAHELTHVVQQNGRVQRQKEGMVQRALYDSWDTRRALETEEAVDYLFAMGVPKNIARPIVQEFTEGTEKTTDLRALCQIVRIRHPTITFTEVLEVKEEEPEKTPEPQVDKSEICGGHIQLIAPLTNTTTVAIFGHGKVNGTNKFPKIGGVKLGYYTKHGDFADVVPANGLNPAPYTEEGLLWSDYCIWEETTMTGYDNFFEDLVENNGIAYAVAQTISGTTTEVVVKELQSLGYTEIRGVHCREVPTSSSTGSNVKTVLFEEEMELLETTYESEEWENAEWDDLEDIKEGHRIWHPDNTKKIWTITKVTGDLGSRVFYLKHVGT